MDSWIGSSCLLKHIGEHEMTSWRAGGALQVTIEGSWLCILSGFGFAEVRPTELEIGKDRTVEDRIEG